MMEAQPMVPPGGLAGPPTGAGGPQPLGLPPMANTGITGGMGGPITKPLPLGQPSMSTPDPGLSREAARNQRMNTGWQQQLQQQGGMGYATPALSSLVRSGG